MYSLFSNAGFNCSSCWKAETSSDAEVLGSANVSPLVFLTLLKALYSTFVLQMLTRQVLQRRANRLGLKFPTYE